MENSIFALCENNTGGSSFHRRGSADQGVKIALDATYSVGEELSGIGVYSQEIIKGLACAYAQCDWLCCYRPHRILRSLSRPLPPAARRRLLTDKWSPDAHLFHGLNQRLPHTRYQREVTTFHDLFVMTAEYSSPGFRARFSAQARTAADRSDLIVCVSQFTASQVVNLLGVPLERTRVIHHGVRFPVAGVDTASSNREPIVLSVSAIQHRKNTLRLIEAFERTPPGWRLLLVGSSGYGAEAVYSRLAQSPRRAAIELTGYVTDAQLLDLYRRASIFSFPSLDEGFGMPVLEAMACGLPVLASNVSALPEVCGDAAVLVDPRDTDALADGLTRLMHNDSLRADLRARGLARASQFTWESAIRKTWQVYQELL